MSDYELVPPDLYDDLPEEPVKQFLLIARAALNNADGLIHSSDMNGPNGETVRSRLMGIVRSAAEHLEIDGLPPEWNSDTNGEEYDYFVRKLEGLMTRLRLQSAKVHRPDTVALAPKTKARIGSQVQSLISDIEASNLPRRKKDDLIEKLREFLTELERNRVSFAKVMPTLALLATTFGGTMTGLANAPKAMGAVTTIMALFGHDKQKEEEERLRLTAPTPLLPAPSSTTLKYRSLKGSFVDDLDDDLPF